MVLANVINLLLFYVRLSKASTINQVNSSSGNTIHVLGAKHGKQRNVHPYVRVVVLLSNIPLASLRCKQHIGDDNIAPHPKPSLLQ